jgi:meiotically up-regulated gene 157 (Mug157) protein
MPTASISVHLQRASCGSRWANLIRALARCAIVAILTIGFVGLPDYGGAQPLIVPLTGKRARPIDPASLFHTLFSDFFTAPDGTTYVQTGDIAAMWLRDSSEQTIPYIWFEPSFPVLHDRFTGVIERNARNIAVDPYANAFSSDYYVYERKWEVDSLAWPMLLASVYWRETADRSIFTPALHRALQTVVNTYRCEQQHRTCSRYRFRVAVKTNDAYNEDTGMIWGAFRPSDDAVTYRFNIPQQVIAVVASRAIEELARDGFGDERLARAARAVGDRVWVGIERYGVAYLPRYGGWVYVYETDGNGNYNMMDDANIPNLITLPYLNWCSIYDPVYVRTRYFALSNANPYYYRGTYGMGLGSPHTPTDFVWPLGIIGRALTSSSSAEVAASITTLAETDSEQGLIHESFYDGGYWRFTRADFGWANALGAHLVFETIAGFPSTPFVASGVLKPFEHRGRIPSLVPEITQLDNAGLVLSALARTLEETRGAMR